MRHSAWRNANLFSSFRLNLFYSTLMFGLRQSYMRCERAVFVSFCKLQGNCAKHDDVRLVWCKSACYIFL
jgi:hypothetical protein